MAGNYANAMKNARKKKNLKPGKGGRFAALKAKLAQQTSTADLSAMGKNKFGSGKMSGWAAMGKK